MRITINILPESYKEKIRKQRLFSYVLSYIWGMVFLTFFFLALLFGTLLGIGSQEKLSFFSGDEMDKKNLQSLLEYDSILSKKNEDIDLVRKLLDNQKNFTKIFSFLHDIDLTGVSFTSFTVTNENKVELKGYSQTRDEILTLQEKFRGNECFFDVEIPIEYLVKKESLDFSILFGVHDSCLVEKI